jgi:hypothetical protein
VQHMSSRSRMQVDMKNLGEKKLEALIEEATVDCYSDDEAAMGLFTMLKDNLVVPFSAHVFGMPVKVTAVERNACARRHSRGVCG